MARSSDDGRNDDVMQKTANSVSVFCGERNTLYSMILLFFFHAYSFFSKRNYTYTLLQENKKKTRMEVSKVDDEIQPVTIHV